MWSNRSRKYRWFLRNDGYKAAEKAISEMTKEFVIKNIIDSGLRGRGGGGFPTGIKWDIASKKSCWTKIYSV